MDVLLHSLSVCEYKTYKKKSADTGIEPMYFVSKEYCYHMWTRLATAGCNKQPPFRNIHPWNHMSRKINDL